MSNATTIQLYSADVIPHGNAQSTQAIIALWQDIQAFFQDFSLIVQGRPGQAPRPYQLSLDAGDLVARLTQAASHDSFDDYLKAHVKDARLAVDARLSLSISCQGESLPALEAYQVATIFWQQLVMAANIALPGSLQLLGCHYEGPESHQVEAQAFDSRIFYGAQRIANQNGWPLLQAQPLAKVWAWLEACESSQTDTAILPINKVLFTLLKVAEQRHEYSARTVLLVLYQLEILLDCRNSDQFQRIRNRARLILGDLPQSADCFKALYEVRNSLFLGDQPVHRPPLICHDTAEVLKEQIGQHNSAVELGTALVTALLHDLLQADAKAYHFQESVRHH